MSRPRTYTSGQIDRARKKARKGGWVLKKQSGTAYQAVRAKKSTSTRRRTTRRTTTRRTTANPLRGAFRDAPMTLRLGGDAYMKHSISTRKTEANAEAKRMRSEVGRNARVVKRKIGSRNYYFVYKGGSRRARSR